MNERNEMRLIQNFRDLTQRVCELERLLLTETEGYKKDSCVKEPVTKIDFSNHPDALPMNLDVRKSNIHGNGLFNIEFFTRGYRGTRTHNITRNGLWVRTTTGSFINHSNTPNCRLLQEGDKVILIPLVDISVGEELTVDYTKYACGLGIRVIEE